MMRDETVGASILAMAAAATGGLPDVYLRRIKNRASRYLSGLRQSLSRPPLISGNDLEVLGIPAGPSTGKVLKHVRNAQDRGEVFGRKEALRLAREIHSRNFP
jgi:hypothetical protein